MKIILSCVLSLVFCVGLFLAAGHVSDSCQSIREYENQQNAVVAGKIIDKRVENGYSFLLSGHTPQRYYLVVQWEYDNNEELVAREKIFEVERDTYLAYNIGDYFDSQNFNIADCEQQDKNPPATIESNGKTYILSESTTAAPEEAPEITTE